MRDVHEPNIPHVPREAVEGDVDVDGVPGEGAEGGQEAEVFFCFELAH